MKLKINWWRFSTLGLSFTSIILSAYKWIYYSLYDIAYQTTIATRFYWVLLVAVTLHAFLLLFASIEKKQEVKIK